MNNFRQPFEVHGSDLSLPASSPAHNLAAFLLSFWTLLYVPPSAVDVDTALSGQRVANFLALDLSAKLDVPALSGGDLLLANLNNPASSDTESPAMDAQLIARLGDLSPYIDYFSPGVVLSDSSEVKMFFEQKENKTAAFQRIL